MLDDISADFIKGESYAILGDRDSGTEALLSIIAGTSRASTGRVVREGSVSMPLSATTQIAPHKTGRELAFFLARLYRADANETLQFAMNFSGLSTKVINTPVRAMTVEERVMLSFSLGYAIPADVYLFEGDVQYGSSDFRSRCREAYAIRREKSGAIIATRDVRRAIELAQRGCVLSGGRLYMFDTIDDAVDMYHRLKIGSNENTHVHVRSLVQMGEAERAEEYLRELASQGDGSADTYAMLAELSLRAGRNEDAIAAAEMAIQKGGRSVRLSAIIVKAKEATGDFEGAVRHIDALTTETGMPPTQFLATLAVNLEKSGDITRAGLVWKRLAVDTGSPVAFRRAQTNLQRAELWSELLDLSDWALTSKPQDLALLEMRFQILVAKGDWPETVSIVRHVAQLNSIKAINLIFSVARTDNWPMSLALVESLSEACLQDVMSERSTFLLERVLSRQAVYARKANRPDEANKIEKVVRLLTGQNGMEVEFERIDR